MCGIAGIIGVPDKVNLEKMLLATQHRGPNHTGQYVDHTVALGMNRLAIIDTSIAGNQPMYSQDGRYIMVFNGEVYNFKSLRKGLRNKGYTFHSNSDTEVVLNLFLEYGENCLNYLRGMFAFFIWDKQKQKGFAARDHFGIKPLLYHYAEGILTFCSEIKGFLANPIIKKNLNKNALCHYLSLGFITPEQTILKSIKALKPGHYFTFENGNIDIQLYWSLETKPAIQEKSFGEAVKQTRNLLLNAVEEQLISDVPLGVFLSGGLDSATIVAAMKLSGAKNIKTFSLGFESNDNTLNETNLANQSAIFFKTQHRSITLKAKEIVSDFDNFIQSLDQPTSDGLNSYFISKYTVPHVTVALSGLGGDEIFNGYGHVRSIHATLPWKRKASTLIQFLGSLPGIRKIKENNDRWLSWEQRQTILQEYIDVFTKVFYHESTSKKLLVPGFMPKGFSIEKDFIQEGLYSENSQLNSLQKIGLLDFRGFMGSRLLRDSDATTMFHSLELRPPFLDPRLAEFAFQLPIKYKLGEIIGVQNSYNSRGIKKLLYEAFKEELPQGIMDRQVSGFHIPIAYWMKTILAERIQECFLNKVPPFFNKAEVILQYELWKKGKISWRKIWLLYILFEWLDKYKITP